jgi:general secretion pathway protein G
MNRKSLSRGFTLVEILIVVIILGILAAIVIPQFTNASNDARNNSVASTLQTLRSQIELFKIQHADLPPTDATNFLNLMQNASNTTGTTVAGGTDATHTLGPYIQAAPVNPANGQSAVGAAVAATVGWVYTVSGSQYTIQAVNTTGDVVLTY